MNDSSVSSIGINQLKGSQPYILFYIKRIKDDIRAHVQINRKRKDSFYEEGDLHCKRKESKTFSVDSDMNGKAYRKISIDSRESMSKLASHKSTINENSNEIDRIFSSITHQKQPNGTSRKYSKDDQTPQIQVSALPTMITKPEGLVKLEMSTPAIRVSIPPVPEIITDTVTLVPVMTVTPDDVKPKLSTFSKQFRINKMNKLNTYYNPPVSKQTLAKKNLNESPSPTVSVDKNFNELVQGFEETFGFIPKRKDSYDADYDKGKLRKIRVKKAKQVYDFQRIADKKI